MKIRWFNFIGVLLFIASCSITKINKDEKYLSKYDIKYYKSKTGYNSVKVNSFEADFDNKPFEEVIIIFNNIIFFDKSFFEVKKR